MYAKNYTQLRKPLSSLKMFLSALPTLLLGRARKTIPDYIITKANRVFYKHEELSRFKDTLQKVVFVNNSQQKNKTRKS